MKESINKWLNIVNILTQIYDGKKNNNFVSFGDGDLEAQFVDQKTAESSKLKRILGQYKMLTSWKGEQIYKGSDKAWNL